MSDGVITGTSTPRQLSKHRVCAGNVENVFKNHFKRGRTKTTKKHIKREALPTQQNYKIDIGTFEVLLNVCNLFTNRLFFK